jgi:hydrogenase 3 maturation protease
MLSNPEECSISGCLSAYRENNILFAGIGNVLRSDDGIGVYICKGITETARIKTLIVEVSIENYIGKINSLKPDALILVDCMNLNMAPGSHAIKTIGNITDHTFNTHNISLSRIADFFRMPVLVLGMQPQNTGFGDSFSPAVKKSADAVIEEINNMHRINQ